jgi:hypothetical protein
MAPMYRTLANWGPEKRATLITDGDACLGELGL